MTSIDTFGIPQGVVEHRETVQDKTINKTICKIQLFRRQVMDSPVGLLQRESYCPGIALSEHEAKLHFIAQRANTQERIETIK